MQHQSPNEHEPQLVHQTSVVEQSAYKKFFWALMASMIVWTGLGAYALISVTKDVQYISQSLRQLDSSVSLRLTHLEQDMKDVLYWKGIQEGRNGRTKQTQ